MANHANIYSKKINLFVFKFFFGLYRIWLPSKTCLLGQMHSAHATTSCTSSLSCSGIFLQREIKAINFPLPLSKDKNPEYATALMCPRGPEPSVRNTVYKLLNYRLYNIILFINISGKRIRN